MKKIISKKKMIVTIFAACIFVLTSNVAFALPGFKPYIADRSGEYVYYRDYSFKRESYVGFLAYDEATYAVRYYAPADSSKKLLEESIVLYFSVDTNLPHLRMTGERIGSAITEEQTDLVNYLHDLIYDFNARRIKAGEVNLETVNLFASKQYQNAGLSISQDYPQFGGNVYILFDYLVPLFNIKKIISNDNKVLFEFAMSGVLQSSTDTSFLSFSGLNIKNKSSSKKWKVDKSAEKKEFTFANGKKILLDSSWTNPISNLWLLGDEAIVSVSNVSGLSATDSYAGISQLLRMTLQNASFKNLSLTKKDESYIVNGIYYQPDTKEIMRSFRIISPNGDGFDIFLLTVFNDTYEKNRSYFDKIFKSYGNL